MKSLNNVREKRLLNYDELKLSALELLGEDCDGDHVSLTRLNFGLSNDNFELQCGSRHFLLKAYRSEIPEAALRIQQELAQSEQVTTNPIAWHITKRVALFEFWPGEIYSGQQWQRVIPSLVKVHKSASRDESQNGRWCIDVPALLSDIAPHTPLSDEFDMHRVINSLSTYPRFSAYCHNDLVRENILCNGRDIRLIDFEYAGLHDVYFDLAALAVSLKLAKSQAEAMLEHYHLLMMPAHSPLMDKLSDYRLAYLSLSIDWYERRGHKQEANSLLSQLPKWNTN